MKRAEFSTACFLIAGLSLTAANAAAGPREIGLKLYQRLAGTPPPPEELNTILDLANAGKLDDIAARAMDTRGFLLGTVKHMVSPMTNVGQLTTIDLNDFSATVIGMIRDDVPLDRMVYDDIIYLGDRTALTAKGIAVAPFSDDDNSHYRDLELKGVDLRDKTLFVRKKQSQVTILPADSTMGVMTTRSAGDAFLADGTNRRMLRFAMVDFQCRDMEQLHDNTVPDYRVRQDVPRNAGGDSSTYVNTCAGCHAGMDALAGAFAYYDYIQTRRPDGSLSNRRVTYLPFVADKFYRNNNTYPDGYLTKSDDWVNLWLEGQNASLGWRQPANGNMAAGNGAKALGVVMAATRGFSECMAQRAYAEVCGRKAPFSDAEEAAFNGLADAFESHSYNGKLLFKESAKLCVGE